MEKLLSLRKFFRQKLGWLSLCQWIFNIIEIPVNLLIATKLSNTIIDATSGNLDSVISNSVLLVMIIVLKKLFDIIFGFVFQEIKTKVLHKCKIDFYSRLLSQSLFTLYSQNHGTIIENINDDFNTITNKYLSTYPNFLVCIITAIIYFSYIAVQNWMIGICLLIISFLQIIPPLIIKKYLQVNYEDCREIEADITDYMIESHRGFVLLKLYKARQWWLSKLKEHHKTYLKAGKKSIFTGTTESTLNEIFSIILTYGTYIILGLFVLFQKSPLNVALLSISLSSGFYKAIKSIFDVIGNFAIVRSAEKRMHQVYENEKHTECPFKLTTINFHNVEFEYDNKLILHGINLTIDMTKTNIIKGCNGTGKSTILNLMVGLLRPTKGEVSIGGIVSEELSDVNFCKDIFYLPQSDPRFNFTAEELFEMECINLNECYFLASKFNIEKETLKNIKINDLSGGERKKIFLLLGILLETRYLILDEPTNSLDNRGCKILVELLKNKKSGVLIITHDNSFDNIADHIYVVKEGKIYIEK